MTPEDYFEEFMSGEPLTEEAVLAGLAEYSRLILDKYTQDIQDEIEDAINNVYKNNRQ